MSDFNEIANTPMDVELLGRKFKVRRVPLDTIFGKAEAAVISQQMRRIQEMAAGLEGEDKSSFLAKAMLESLPSGERLQQMSLGYLKSPEGVRMVLLDALRPDQPDVEKDLDLSSLLLAEPDKVSSIITFVTGRAGKGSRPLAGKAGK
jgi:hypothetical protein